jgi:putative tricarboxylic transport membrane protein
MIVRFLAVLLIALGLSPAAWAVEKWRLIVPDDETGEVVRLANVLKDQLERMGEVWSVVPETFPRRPGLLADVVATSFGIGNTLMLQSASEMLVGDTDDAGLWRRTALLATITTDYEALAVAPSGPLRSLDALLRIVRDHPRTYAALGGSPRGGVDHAIVGWIEKAAGLEAGAIRYLPAEGTKDALGRFVNDEAGIVIGSLAELRKAEAVGLVRILATSAPKRDTRDDPPTFSEQGLDIVFHNWRGLVAPPGVSEAKVQLMRESVLAAVGSPEWTENLTTFGWTPYVRVGIEFRRLLESQDTLLRGLLR